MNERDHKAGFSLTRKMLEENRKAGYEHGYSDGYNKAVDDYRQSIEALEKAYKERNYAEYEQILFFAKEIAEQLKGAK